MSAVKCSFLLLTHSFLLQTSNCIEFTKWIRWNETDVTFGTPMASESVSLKACLLRCQETLGCTAAHVNEENGLCEFSTYNPLNGTLMATPRLGWTVFYKDLIKAQGTEAWQSSTFADCVASNAIDGKLDEHVCLNEKFCGCLCAHTQGNNSSWVMEFTSPGFVKTIVPFFRVQAGQVWRNTNFSLFVHESFEAGKNGVNGTLCKTYTGEPISSPITFTCQQAVYGQAVRIQDFKQPDTFNAIQLCEMKVFLFRNDGFK